MAVVALVGFGAGCAQVPSWESAAKASSPKAPVKRPVTLLEDEVHEHPNRPLPPVRVARRSVPAKSPVRAVRTVRVARQEDRPSRADLERGRRSRSSDDSATIVAGTTAAGAGIGALVGGKRGALIGAILGGIGGSLLDHDDSSED